MARELELFLTRLEQTTGHSPTHSGDGWQARCPAHDDERPSLSIRSGTGGRVLVYCHAGCTPQAVCRALELDLSALMPDDGHARALARYVAERRAQHRLPSERASGTVTSDSLLAAPCSPLPRSHGNLCTSGNSGEPSAADSTSPTFPTRQDALRAIADRRGEPTGCWEYHNLSGECVGMAVRWDTAQGKAIRPLARVADGWVIGAMHPPRPLYALQDILPLPGTGDEASRAARVWIVEGEKAAEAGRALGLVATTSSGGAAAAHLSDWSPLAGRDVVILPDNDDAGRKYAAAVVAQLVRLRPVPTIRQWRLPGLPPGGDLADYVAARADQPPDAIAAALVEQISPLAPLTSGNFNQETPMSATSSSDTPERPTQNLAGAPAPELAAASRLQSQPVLVSLSDCVSSPLRWLWPQRVPLGKLTLLIGDPGLGKSFVTLDIAARVSRGQPLPSLPGEPTPPSGSPGSVVLLSAEDDVADTIRPRLEAAGADLTRIRALPAVRLPDRQDTASFSLAHDIPALEEAILSLDRCALVVIDPITSYLGRSDSHKNAEIRGLLAPLSELAARTGVAVLAINHLNKMGQGPAIYRSMGSLAFAATARSVLAVFADPHDPSARALLTIKSNVAAAVAGIGFRIAAVDADATATSDGAAGQHGAESQRLVVDWSSTPISMTAEEIMHAATQTAESAPAIHEAAEWLAAVLANGQSQLAAAIKAKAKEDGIHERTLLRAKARLHVVTSRDGFGLDGRWLWSLPKP